MSRELEKRRETQKHERRKSLEGRLKQVEEEKKKTKRREEEENKRREEGKTAKTFLKATWNRKVWTSSLFYLFLKLQDQREKENPKEMA